MFVLTDRTVLMPESLQTCYPVSILSSKFIAHTFRLRLSGTPKNAKALFRITDSLINKPVTKFPKHNDPKILADDFVFFFPEKIKIITESPSMH